MENGRLRVELKDALRYDRISGDFIWTLRTGHRIAVGDKAGTPKDGYVQIGFTDSEGVRHLFRAHRLAWLFMTGAWPSMDIDHIDRDRANNAWANLREATPSENGFNAKIRSDNLSGVKGVSWHEVTGKWLARRGHANVGFFATVKEAEQALEVAKSPTRRLRPRDRRPVPPEIKKMLEYDQQTGEFIWFVGQRSGSIAGSIRPDGYRVIGFTDNRGVFRQFRAHRLAFWWISGRMPDEIDHLDRNRDNNAWDNLRETTRGQNTHNVGLRHDNKSGHRGVAWDADKNKWRAYRNDDHRRAHLGFFADLDDAIAARKAADT